MRYSYLEVYIEENPSNIEIQVYYTPTARWNFTSDGLGYYVHPQDDPTLRLVDVKVPETLPLFNIGVVIDCAFNTPEKLFKRIHLYGAREFRKVGIPTTLDEAKKYDEE
jgi:hypothetical protein